MNPRAVYYTNYVDGYIYAAILTAAKIKCAALHEMVIQTFRGEVIGSGVFRVVIEMA